MKKILKLLKRWETFLVIFLSCFILPIFFPLDVTYTDSSQQNIAPGFTMLSVRLLPRTTAAGEQE